MGLGRKATAARRRASRLAGLVRFHRGSDPQPQSSSLTLPCQILVSVDGCRSLTAYGGCAHWARASSRRPLPRTARLWRAGLLGRHACWPGFYRRSATGLAARGSDAAPCCLYGIDRHSATGLMARKKGQRDFETTLTFSLAKSPSCNEASQPAKGKPAHRRQGKWESAHSSMPQNFQAAPRHPNPQGVSMPHANCGGAERR